MASIDPARSLLGYIVRNREGEELGEVDNSCVADAGTRYAVVRFGGFLGIHTHHFAVPCERLMLDTENECLILDIEPEELERAADFAPDRDRDDTAARTVYRYPGIDAVQRGAP